jgi:hypothetical protein
MLKMFKSCKRLLSVQPFLRISKNIIIIWHQECVQETTITIYTHRTYEWSFTLRYSQADYASSSSVTSLYIYLRKTTGKSFSFFFHFQDLFSRLFCLFKLFYRSAVFIVRMRCKKPLYSHAHTHSVLFSL